MSHNKKRLVVILTWLGATPSAVGKYKQLYSDEEYDFVEYYPIVKDFLWPRYGLSSASNTLGDLEAILAKGEHSSVVIHAFSIGCYYYALMLYQMRTCKQKFFRVQSMICAQVMDSPVIGSTSEMTHGVAKMITRRPALKAAVKCLCQLYLALTKSQTVHYYDIVFAEIKFKSLPVPSLILTSYGDPMIVIEATIDVRNQWKKRHPTTVQIWQDSSHVEHLRFHRAHYKSLLAEILKDSLNIVPSTPVRQHQIFNNSKL